MAIRLTTNARTISIYNIYNNCENNDTLQALETHLSHNTNTTHTNTHTDNHMAWFSDFNCHSPCWDWAENSQLFHSETFMQPFLDLIQDHAMEMALPGGIDTLQNSRGQWTRPDNIWCSEGMMNLFINCNVQPNIRPPKADHLPIISDLDLSINRTDPTPCKNYQETDWEDFQNTLTQALTTIPPPQELRTDEDFNKAVTDLTETIQNTIQEKVPTSKPCPYTKRWWTKDLDKLQKTKNRLSTESYKMQAIPNHPVHAEYKTIANKYTSEITATKNQHWNDWLTYIEGKDVYMANKYATDPPTDYSSA